MKKVILTVGLGLLLMGETGCYSAERMSPESSLQTLQRTADVENNPNSSTQLPASRVWVNGHYEGSTWVRGYFKESNA